MEEKKESKSVANHFEAGSNCQVFNGNISGCVFAMPGATVNQHVPPAASQPEVCDDEYPVAMLVECVELVRGLFWGDSSMAVVFCVCRDCYGYQDNMSQFERDFGCKAGLVSNTFGDNSYMRMHVKTWEKNGAKFRVLKLVEAYKSAVSERAKT